MKTALVAVWLALIAIALSCSIEKRSDGFACDDDRDCPQGRECDDGFCVGGPIDGGPDQPDAGTPPDALFCPSQCTSCKQETMQCQVDCAVSPATCNSPIVCPEGWSCNIVCSPSNACRAGIDCRAGKACTVDCAGTSTCRNVLCGEGPCDVTCSGFDSCRGIQCGDSCACDVECQDPARCEAVFCTSQLCGRFGGGCSSQNPGCNTCP